MPTQNLIIVTNPSHWDIEIEGVTVVSARDYLSQGYGNQETPTRVFNLCHSYAYQSLGYYVSLLAEARGQRAIPSVTTLRDFRSVAIARSMGEEIDEIIQSTLKEHTEKEFTLEVYFGHTEHKNHGKLGAQIFRLFSAPLIRAQFIRKERWILYSVEPISTRGMDEAAHARISEFAKAYFSRRRHPQSAPRQRFLYDMAILVDPTEKQPPSDERALMKFTQAARETGFYVERISHSDSSRLSEFDALFIRETTNVDHPSYRISRLAHAEGLVVIDDPWSILRCANKIFLAETLARAKIPAPKTWFFTRESLKKKHLDQVALPCVLKLPDASFCLGVHRAETPEQLEALLTQLLKQSELILAQEFVTSEYDWRIGVLDHQPLYACKYFMAQGHWQIYNWKAEKSRDKVGSTVTMHTEYVPPIVLDTALRAARQIGDGLYGVDLKQVGDRVVVIEVNDNPSIESSIEDAALGMELYRRIARSFRRRIEQARS